MKLTVFQKKCIAIDPKVMFFPQSDYQDPYEDDAILHVTDKRTKLRATFELGGQDASASARNVEVRKILTALNMRDAINNRTLVEEDNGPERCPYCGELL